MSVGVLQLLAHALVDVTYARGSALSCRSPSYSLPSAHEQSEPVSVFGPPTSRPWFDLVPRACFGLRHGPFQPLNFPARSECAALRGGMP